MKKEAHEIIYSIEKKHWWHRARRSILRTILKKYLAKNINNKILCVGCGTGAELKFLSEFGNVTGLDTSDKAIGLCKKQGLTNVFKCDILKSSPLVTKNHHFDCIMAFDVLEHVENDNAIIKTLHNLLTDNGLLFITVPAFNFLWSPFDELSCHYRRYNKKELCEKLEKNGFQIKKTSYFNSILFPIIYIIRKISSLLKIRRPEKDLKIPSWPMNQLLYFIFQSEKFLISKTNLPFGVSILCVAEKYLPENR